MKKNEKKVKKNSKKAKIQPVMTDEKTEKDLFCISRSKTDNRIKIKKESCQRKNQKYTLINPDITHQQKILQIKIESSQKEVKQKHHFTPEEYHLSPGEMFPDGIDTKRKTQKHDITRYHDQCDHKSC